MKKNLKFFFAMLLIFSVASSAENIPDWYNNPQKQYPAAFYIVGTGSGYNLESALNSAYTQISQQFEVKINANQELKQSYSSAGGVTTSDNLSMNSNTSVSSSLSIKGIEKGPSANVDGKFYALAYIDKSKAVEMYKNGISNNIKTIQNFVSNAEKTSDPVAKYAGYDAAYKKNYENIIMLDQCSIISPNDFKELRGTIDSYKILSQLPSLREQSGSNLKFEVYADNGDIDAYLRSMILNNNFKVIEDGRPAFVATGTIKYTPSNGPSGTVAYLVGVQLEIKNSKGTVVASTVKSLKVVGIDQAAVISLAGKKVVVPATEELGVKFQAYMSSLVQ